MPINQNHLFEELNGVKCAIVEKNVTKERVDFLKQILEYNHYTVIVVSSPPPKIALQAGATPAPAIVPAAAGVTDVAAPATAPPPLPPETFTVGVTDVTFNPTNAIFGRLLKAPGGHVVTLAYWQQKDKEPQDDIPYFNNKK